MLNLVTPKKISLSKNKNLPLYVLVVGHSEKNQGAVNYEHKLTEFKYNSFLANRCLENYVRSNYCYYDGKDILIPLTDIFNLEIVYRTTYKELPKQINKLKPKSIISLHCNAFNTSVSGTETLYADTSERGKSLARVLQNYNVADLGLKDRGLKACDIEDRGSPLLFGTKAPCIISEPFFIDNSNDLLVGLEKIDELAENLLKTFLFMEGLPSGVVI